MAWGTAISFGVSALGHLLNRTGGRGKVTASMANTDFIDQEIGGIRQRNEQMTNKFLQTANAGSGFTAMNSQRMQGAMGTPGQSNMLMQSQVQGREQAFNAGMMNEQGSQQSINQLLGQKTTAELQNANARNNADATNFQAARSDNTNFWNTLMAGGMGVAGQMRDDSRFGQSMDMMNARMGQNQSMFDAYMASLNPQSGQPASGNWLPKVNNPNKKLPWG